MSYPAIISLYFSRTVHELSGLRSAECCTFDACLMSSSTVRQLDSPLETDLGAQSTGRHGGGHVPRSSPPSPESQTSLLHRTPSFTNDHLIEWPSLPDAPSPSYGIGEAACAVSRNESLDVIADPPPDWPSQSNGRRFSLRASGIVRSPESGRTKTPKPKKLPLHSEKWSCGFNLFRGKAKKDEQGRCNKSRRPTSRVPQSLKTCLFPCDPSRNRRGFKELPQRSQLELVQARESGGRRR
ncbi:hypothetical protein BCR34DRAFT_575894 [Clohesyomyces aquaticus]|uniref:Uncharacterized protein n=1 Tax=Clohesyomyces aquaticus TaxID=1231657 RepID=A0A1Y1YR62_9PLEO|nr:hypothetical protein BCR34DRAFT_575894 [Clohesyomyces aquaticus]